MPSATSVTPSATGMSLAPCQASLMRSASTSDMAPNAMNSPPQSRLARRTAAPDLSARKSIIGLRHHDGADARERRPEGPCRGHRRRGEGGHGEHGGDGPQEEDPEPRVGEDQGLA